MAISSAVTEKAYKPGGAMTAEALTGIAFLDPDDLVVEHWPEGATEGAVVARDVAYTIGGNGPAAAGTITALGGYPANDEFRIRRETEPLQPEVLPATQPLSAADIERMGDRLTLIMQELIREEGRALVTPRPEPGMTLPFAASRANKALFFDEDGNPTPIGIEDFSEAAAEQARLATVAASTAEAISGPTYASIAAGLLATGNGKAFAVDNGDGTISVYLNVDGIATFQRTIATTTFIEGMIDLRKDTYVVSGDYTGTDTEKLGSMIGSARSVVIPLGQRLTVDMGVFDGLQDVVFSGGGELKVNYNGNAAGLKFTNCKRLIFHNIKFIGTSDEDAGVFYSAAAHAGIWFADGCEFPRVVQCSFTKFSSWGIRAQNLAGGVNTRGLVVTGCMFYDFDQSTVTQAFWPSAILLQEDAEYSQIIGNFFYHVPAAVSARSSPTGAGCANLLIKNNIIQKCTNYDTTAGAVQTNRACIYIGGRAEDDPVAQGGKIEITGNLINHNDSGIIPIVVKGVSLLPQNVVQICNNYLLENGTPNIPHQIYMTNSPHALVSGNVLRPKSSAPALAVLHMVNCGGTRVNSNDFQDYYYAVYSNKVFLDDGCNTYTGSDINPAGAKFLDQKAITGKRAFTRVAGATGQLLGSFQSSAELFTCVRNGAGDYTLTFGPATLAYITEDKAQYGFDIQLEDWGHAKPSEITDTHLRILTTDTGFVAADKNFRVGIFGFTGL